MIITKNDLQQDKNTNHVAGLEVQGLPQPEFMRNLDKEDFLLV